MRAQSKILDHTAICIFPTAMANFLFWNINRKPLDDAVYRLVELHRVDILMLAECPLSAGQMLVSLNRNGGGWKFAAPTNPLNDSRIQIYTRLGEQNIQEVLAFPYATVRELNRPNSLPILLSPDTLSLSSKNRSRPASNSIIGAG